MATIGTTRRRLVFVSHSAVAAGAELLMLRLLREHEMSGIVVVFLQHGDLVETFERAGIPVEVVELAAEVRTFRRESAIAEMLRLAAPITRSIAALARVLHADDVVVASSQKAFVLACLARARKRFTLIWWLHDILTPEHFSPWVIRVVVGLSRVFCRRVLVTSPEARDAYLAAGGRAPTSHVIEPGIDLSAFDAPPAPSSKRASSERPLVLSVGRISPWKGQRTIVQALAHVPEVDCWIIGAPLFGAEDVLADLEARVEAHDLAGRVRFLGHRDDLPDLLRQGSIFVHVPSAPEPFGQVVIEAMASGLPVIVTNSGAPGRIVDEAFGIRIEHDDPAALAAAIRRLAADPARRRDMGERARTAAQRYDLLRMRNEFFALLDEIRRAGQPVRAP